MGHVKTTLVPTTINGTVMVIYSNGTKDEQDNLKHHLGETMGILYPNLKDIESENCDISGFYLDPILYREDNLEQVQKTLWVLEDVLGNEELDEWSSSISDVITIADAGSFMIHTGYQQLDDITLRVLVVEQKLGA